MTGLEYPKIDTLYERDGEHFVIAGKLRRQEFGNIKIWSVTEKVHGINSRVPLYENGVVVYGGKTDDAEIMPEIYDYMSKKFTQERMKAAFWVNPRREGPMEIPKSATIYG